MLPCFAQSQVWLQSWLQGLRDASISPRGGGQGGIWLLLATQGRISSFHPSPGLPPPSPGAAMAVLGVQPLASAFRFFLSNSMFHQKAEIFSAASETQARVSAGLESCSEIPPGRFCCCSPHSALVQAGVGTGCGAVWVTGPLQPLQAGSCVGANQGQAAVKPLKQGRSTGAAAPRKT